MKAVKLIISFFVILLAFVLGGEAFQNYIGTYTNQFYYFDIVCRESEAREEVCSMLENLAEKNHAAVFASQKTVNSVLSYKTVVYASESEKNLLESVYGVKSGDYKSFFSGMTSVEFENFNKAAENKNISRYYFIGDITGIQAIRESMNKKYAASGVHKEFDSSNHWLIIAVWVLIGLLLLILTWFDIQFQKKENFVLISLGVSKLRIIVKNIVIDSLVISGIFAVLLLTLSYYTYTGYELLKILIIFACVIFSNAALYLTLLRINLKETLYGANINDSTASNCYVLKVLTTIVAVAVLSSNIILIADNAAPLLQFKKIERYSDYSFLSVNMHFGIVENHEEISSMQEVITNSIFIDLYKEGKAALSILNYYDQYNYPYLYVNSGASELFDAERIGNKDLKNSCLICVPSTHTEKGTAEKNAYEITVSDFGFPLDIEYETVVYDESAKIPYFESRSPSAVPLSYDTVKNPVVIYCDFPLEILKTVDPSSMLAKSFFTDVMFKVSAQDLEDIEEKYGLEELGLYMTSVKVTDRCGTKKAELTRITLLNTVISIFLLLLGLTIISTLVKLEYKTHATELSLKKILGYPVYRKNRALFLLNVYAAAIGIGTIVIISLMYGYSLWYIVLLMGFLLLLLDCAALTFYIVRLERTSVPKILKGGSL